MAELDIHPASDAERAAAHRNVFEIWPCAKTLEEHVKLRMEKPRYAKATWFVACVDGEVACSLSRHAFGFRIRGEDVRGIGIGSVFTVPAHRGHGYAPRLMRHIHELALADDVGMSILYSNIAPAYYGRMGYVECPSFDGWRSVDSSPEVEPARLSEFEGAAELEAMAALYDLDHGKRLMSVKRDRTNWTEAFEHFTQDRFFWLFEDRYERRAYCRVRPDGDSLHIVDTAFAPEARACEGGVYAALLAEAGAKGFRRLGGWLMDSPVGRSFFEVVPRKEEIAMVKPLIWGRLLDAEALASTAGFCELDHV